MITVKIIVTILQLTSIVLLTALLLTPAHKHPIVNSIVVLSILHCIICLLPPLLYIVKFSASFEDLTKHRGLASFCVADSILNNYFTIVKAAFAISFTLPCVYLAWKFTRTSNGIQVQSGPELYRWTTIALCAGPFLWALPVIFAVIPKLGNPLSLSPGLHGAACTIVNNPGQILALLLTLIPLTIAVIASMLLILILWKYYKLPDLKQSIQILQPLRIIRFAALVSTIIVSAVLYSIVLATWVHVQTDRSRWEYAFDTWLATSAIWEAISPLIFFFIFIAQEEIYTVWVQGFRGCLPHHGQRSRGTSITVLSKQPAAFRRLPRIFSWFSDRHRHLSPEELVQKDTQIDLSDTDCPKRRDGGIATVEAPRLVARHIMQISYANFAVHQDPGLHPPPRHQQSRNQSPRESTVFNAVPSLSALESYSGGWRQPTPSELLDCLRVECPHFESGEEGGSDEKPAPLTPSDERFSKGEIVSKVEDVTTQISVVSTSSLSVHSRPVTAAASVGAMDPTDTFGVISSL